MWGVFRREYIRWNIKADWMPIRNVRVLLRAQAVGLHIQTQNTGSVKTHKSQLRSVERNGFFQSSSSDRLTDEQKEDLIAENIYDWWISGKSYKRWYADKFLQLKFDLSEDNETQTGEENNGMV